MTTDPKRPVSLRSLLDLPSAPKSRNKMSRAALTLTGGGYGYHIDRHRIDTPGKVIHWLAHLTESKDWFTLADARDVLAYAQRYGGVDLYGEAT